MTIERRIQKAEQALNIGPHPRPHAIVLSAKREMTLAERQAWEARTQARVEEAIRRRPTDPLILLC